MIQRWVRQILKPKVDDQRLHDILSEAQQRLPPPVIWLLGKAQSGKTSIVRTLTQATDAEIGNGFKPCTPAARLYSYPNEEACLLRFLDTRGLGEAGYDPGEDLAYLEQQSHLVMVVLKAGDAAQQSLLNTLSEVRRRHPDWPLIVVQTSLHELYPPGMAEHPQPYPFGTEPWPASVPIEVSQALAYQRGWFKPAAAEVRFVPVDFTLESEGIRPNDYGREALAEAIAEVGPHALRALFERDAEMIAQLRDTYFSVAHPQIVGHAIAAGMASAVPAPGVSTAASLAIVGKMFQTLASIYGQTLTPQIVVEMAGCLGVTFALRAAGRSALQMVPGVNVVVSIAAAAYMAGVTYALGRTLCFYFDRVRRGARPDSQRLREEYAQSFKQGMRMSREYFQGVGQKT
jgi:uncharacterized protein (DUF697 family)